MIFDWVVSLLVASMVALTLVLVGMGAVNALELNAAVGSDLGAVVGTVATHVDRDEGLAAATAEGFTFGTYAPGGEGTTLPTEADGHLYQLTVTPDFILASTAIPGGTMARSASFAAPVHLYSAATLQALAAAGGATTQAQLQAWDSASPCIAFPAGVDFTVTVLLVEVDAAPVYLTVIYPTGYAPSTCP